MINLIPNTEKKEMKKGLYYRLVVLFLATCGFVLFIISVAILPSYFLSSTKNDILNAKLEMQKSEPVPVLDQETLSIIKDLNKKIDLVENSEKNKFTVSEKVINAILVRKTPSIEITQISYEDDPLQTLPGGKLGKKISIRGTAPSREVLLSFRQSLEDGATFKQVNLPISNFVKGSNIQFYLSLIPQ